MCKRKSESQAKCAGFKQMVAKKRTGGKVETTKASTASSTSSEYLTVQSLSATVEGKCQKYSRIGPLTMIPFGEEVKEACKKHFKVHSHMECDVLAGKRGLSYNKITQIKKCCMPVSLRLTVQLPWMKITSDRRDLVISSVSDGLANRQ